MVLVPKRNRLYIKACMLVVMKRYSSTGLSIPTEMLERIDSSRGDIPRSKFLLRLLEQVYPTENEAKKEAVTVN
jgi:hypothetical protein